jgi:genome maintenance exonuclease 1
MQFIRNRVFEKFDIPTLGYSDLNTISEKSARIYVTPEGEKYPSITTILSLRSRDAIQEWRNRVGAEEANRVSRHATTRGTAVHNLTEKYLKNEEISFKEGIMPHVYQGFIAAQKILDKYIGRIALQEAPLYSDYLRLAGRVDLIAEFDGKLSIVDFKTSKRVKTEEDIEDYFIQECAYAIMFEERTGVPITQLVTIMVVDGKSEPLLFRQHRDKWAAELIKVRAEYDKAKLFGHI